ncbi:MAG: phosphoglucosamine mutase [Oscillospiraceae bacterium]|nr:phosphoglucosamine mutase [Oscillospiraceae bacterium]
MGKLFGTDGIRGVANETLDCRLAYRVGQAAAISLTKKPGVKPSVVIGKDTRISSDMLEGALIAGLTASGCNVVRLGVIPTPGVAYLTVKLHADAGVVISASHNPFEHNGIKMFSGEGFKLSDALEEEIESLILREGELPVKTGAALGQVMDGAFTADQYLNHLASTVGQLPRMRVLIDCANGAASATARKLFSRFALNVDYINDTPNGVNINNHCGSTHIEMLAEKVREGGYALGLAFDGDADRCLAVDENGGLIDGDQIMAICADTLTKQGKLTGSGFVATVMSNIGLHKYCAEHGLRLLCASVGDRNVLEMMQREGMALGGEQSGHIIFLEHMTTGDGQLAALQLLSILAQSGRRASELASAVTRYPQVLLNVRVGGNDEKKAIMESPLLGEAIRKAEAGLGGNGRVLVRASGTEPLIRVMVEAGSEQTARETAETLVHAVENLQK